MANDSFENYKRLNTELTQLEARMETVRSERAATAQQLFEQDGKGVVYDLGDGVPMIIVASKAKTYFFTPKDKWKKSGRTPKAKKAIVNGQVVEVQTRTVYDIVDPMQSLSSPQEVITVDPGLPAGELNVIGGTVKPRRVEVAATLKPASAVGVGEVKASSVVDESDPLAAALAEAVR